MMMTAIKTLITEGRLALKCHIAKWVGSGEVTIYSDVILKHSVKTYKCSKIYQYVNIQEYKWLSYNTDDNIVSGEHHEKFT